MEMQTVEMSYPETGFRNAASAGGPAIRIVFFGHDSTESTIIKRVRAFQSYGAAVTGFMFSRSNDAGPASPAWPNIPLGTTYSRRFADRGLKLLSAIAQAWRHRALLRQADVFYARNLDMLCIAAAAKTITRAEAPIVYEALDVHPYLTGGRAVGGVLRALERRLLARISLLVVSSPMFMRRYFEPTQNYRGAWYLLENKVPPSLETARRPSSVHRRTHGSPWIIGWFGALRCRRSLELLEEISRSLGDKVQIHIRGVPAEVEGITAALLAEICARNRNIFYFGPYRNPTDLDTIYGAIDIAWAVDYSAAGFNSDWLIPNRLYEGGVHGVPAIARRSTATGDVVEREGIGWCFEEPLAKGVGQFLEGLDRATYDGIVSEMNSKERAAFVDLADTKELLERLKQL